MEILGKVLYRGDPVDELLKPLITPINENDLYLLACRFSAQYNILAGNSLEHFLPTPVTVLPTGKEEGRFLSIDVGGTNLRVGFVELLGEKCISTGTRGTGGTKIRRHHEKAWPIEDHLKMDQAEDLFAWIGDCIAEVVSAALNQDVIWLDEIDELPLGITFSFPMTQTCMSEATLMPMGKGFVITSDMNLGKMLLAGYARHCEPQYVNGSISPQRKLPRLRVAAITNDTVATFASLAYSMKSTPNSRVAMGLIVGTGTNATVPMKLSSLHPSKKVMLHLPTASRPENTTVIINTEWTIRGTDLPMRELGIPTAWDRELDSKCEAPGFQPFEYMTAGRYLGEIVRLALLDFISQRFPHGQDNLPHGLRQKNSISTMFLATVVARSDDDMLVSKLNETFPTVPSQSGFRWTKQEAILLRALTSAVKIRSCALIAAAIVGLLACVGEIQLADDPRKAHGLSCLDTSTRDSSKVAREELVVAYAGSLIQLYPNFLETCQAWIDRLTSLHADLNLGKRVCLREATNGGIIGAAVLAGMAIR